MIFEKTGTKLNPYTSSIILGVALLLGSVLTTYMADSFGRKFLNIFSLVGSSFGLFAVSLYQYLNMNGHDMSAFAWVPVVSLSFVIFISSAGIFSLAFVCSVEYLPPKVRKKTEFNTILFILLLYLYILTFSLDSYLCFRDHLLLDQRCHILLCEIVPNFTGNDRFTRMYVHIWGRKCIWCNVCVLRSRRNKWTMFR